MSVGGPSFDPPSSPVAPLDLDPIAPSAPDAAAAPEAAAAPPSTDHGSAIASTRFSASLLEGLVRGSFERTASGIVDGLRSSVLHALPGDGPIALDPGTVALDSYVPQVPGTQTLDDPLGQTYEPLVQHLKEHPEDRPQIDKLLKDCVTDLELAGHKDAALAVEQLRLNVLHSDPKEMGGPTGYKAEGYPPAVLELAKKIQKDPTHFPLGSRVSVRGPDGNLYVIAIQPHANAARGASIMRRQLTP